MAWTAQSNGVPEKEVVTNQTKTEPTMNCIAWDSPQIKVHFMANKFYKNSVFIL